MEHLHPEYEFITAHSNTSKIRYVRCRNCYEDALKKLMDIINEKNITTVVLGLPKNMDNTMGFAAKRSLNFKDMLGKEGIKVILEDERLTTVEAINIMKNNGVKKINEKNKTDIVSAVLILEGYLKRCNNDK